MNYKPKNSFTKLRSTLAQNKKQNKQKMHRECGQCKWPANPGVFWRPVQFIAPLVEDRAKGSRRLRAALPRRYPYKQLRLDFIYPRTGSSTTATARSGQRQRRRPGPKPNCTDYNHQRRRAGGGVVPYRRWLLNKLPRFSTESGGREQGGTSKASSIIGPLGTRGGAGTSIARSGDYDQRTSLHRPPRFGSSNGRGGLHPGSRASLPSRPQSGARVHCDYDFGGTVHRRSATEKGGGRIRPSLIAKMLQLRVLWRRG